jgi:hypothetical protein
MSGCGIWYFSQKKSTVNSVLIVSAFIVVSLFSTDLMPANIRNTYIYPYYLRTVPVLLIWVKLIFDMLNSKTYSEPEKLST